VKKLVLGAAAAAALATSVVLVPSVAGAAGSTGGGSQVSINQYADFNFNGTQLDLGVNVSCTGGTGTVNVSVKQDYPETWSPTGALGTGVQNVVCDGRTRYVTVTIVGAPYDGGKATATAALMAPSGNVTVTRRISIRAT
jgi:hypothetical protein